MLDYDNDGDKDLLAINGYVMPESTFDDEWNLTPSRLWRNPGAAAAAGPWPDIADELGLADTANGRGLLLVDYDLDGDLDVFQANYAGPPRLFRNDGPSGAAWLRVVALEAAGGRESLGAMVTVVGMKGQRQTGWVGSPTAFQGQSEAIVHFGLGATTGLVGVEVRWSAPLQRLRLPAVAPNQLLRVHRPPTGVQNATAATVKFTGLTQNPRVDPAV